MEFTGFRPKGLDLLMENRMHNSKDFYDANKEQIKALALEPFYALIERMTPTMRLIDPLFMTTPQRMLSRVRRDTRFTRDTTLYRSNLWLTFSRRKDDFAGRPCYYFEIAPESWSYGCGYYQAPPAEMRIARDMMLAENKIFTDAYHALAATTRFSLYGDSYKRPKFPDAPAAYQDWLNRKNIGVMAEFTDHAPLFDGSFVDNMLSDMQGIAPLYHLLCAIKDRARDAEETQ